MKNGKTIVFGPGDAVIYGKDEAHDQKMETDGIDHCIQFRIHDADLAGKIGRCNVARNIRSMAVLKDLEEMSHWQEEDSQEAKNFRVTSLILSLLWESDRKKKEIPESGFPFAEEAKKIVSSEISSPPSLNSIARRIGISGEYLRHLFRKQFGVGLKEFSLEKRLERAKELLLHSPMRLKEIAESCGFANERAFCTAFKGRTGITPGNFKKR
ncbi:MAG: AraC family transcriptional regulator [Victivallales bacterium]